MPTINDFIKDTLGNRITDIARDSLGMRQMFNGYAGFKGYDRDDSHPSKYFLKAPQEADQFKPSNNPVRQKFNGYVNFVFNSALYPNSEHMNPSAEFTNKLSSLVRTATMPSAEFATAVQNQYNRKRITVSSVDYKPVQIAVFDTVDSVWVAMLMRMYAHLFTNPTNLYPGSGITNKSVIENDIVPEIVASGDGNGTSGSFNRPFNSNSAGLNLQPAQERNFITSIDIVQYHGGRAIKYTLFNPMITSFEIDGIDYSDSSANQINLNIEYENFTIDPNINAFIEEDDLKRFSDFNKKEWEVAQQGNAQSLPTVGNNYVYPLDLQERKVEFLNGVSRREQVDFLSSFASSNDQGDLDPTAGGE